MVKQRILSFVLAFCMAFMLIPTTAFAANEAVGTLAALQTAITNATGTEENPTVIVISGQIEVNQTIEIPAGKYIKLVGENSNDGLIRADSFTFANSPVTNSSHLLSVQGGLVLEGITIDGNNKSGGSLVFIYGNNAFAVMNEGTTLKNNLNGAVNLYSQNSTQGNPCHFIMNGGTICNNSASQGAGVAIINYGYADFTMSGGVIKENTATSAGGGGAIYSCASGTVTISGGKIIGNKSTGSEGGAMNVTGRSALVITGGEISNNHITTSKRGGGIYKSGNAAFTMTGGVIKDNSTARNDGREGQDIYIASGDFNLGGTAQIPDGLFIERYNNSSDRVRFYITSPLQNNIGIEGLWTSPSEGRVVAVGKDYTITQSDFEKISYNHASLVLKFDKDNNQIVLGKPSCTVAYTLLDMTFDGPEEIEKGNSLTTKLNPSVGYHSPSSITVKINGVELDKMNYQAVPVQGGIGVYIPAEHVTGNVEISAVAEAHFGGTATCTALAVCTGCRQSYGSVNPDNHTNLVKTEAKAATHLETGNREYWYCDGCNKYFSDEAGTKEITLESTVIPKLTEHTADDTGWHSDETNHWNTCECGEVINKEAHSFGEWTTTKEATKTEPGSRTKSCTVCGYKVTESSLKTDELTQKYTDTSEHTYTPDWSGLPSGQTWSYSSEYSVSNGSIAKLTKQDIAAANGKLTYAISGGKAGDKITITLKASCDNYEDFTITLNVTLTEKDDQKPLTIIGDTSVIYGEKLTLTTTGGSGTGAVTYHIGEDNTGEATIDPETGVLTPVKVGSVSVIAAKAGDNDYNDITSAPFVLMIKPATPSGEPNYTKITTSGKTLKDAALTAEGSTLKPNGGKLEWVDDKGNVLPDNTRVEAKTTYKWRFTPDDDNYTALTGEVELYHKSSSGGGGSSGYSYYTIKATAGAGGSISPSGNVSVREGRDQTFTITPDKGYAVANVKIDGKSIGAVKSYTFENVRRTHTIEVIFMKANGTPQTGVFVDVATGSYYEDAVDWAVENGITNGVSSNMFAPDDPCTRAQIVTFLWRAAGSPAPKSMSSFTDVPADAFYAKAVAWAVENGITSGTGEGKFSPNAICTRAQSVTFLYRASGSPAVSGSAEFSDVSTTAFYADAVAWAAKKGITTGIGGGLFGSDNDCTRSQIVTFLWRCKK